MLRISARTPCHPRAVAQGSFGPFKPLIPIEAPLWFALTLKKRQRCRIQLPEWFTTSSLEKWLDGEKRHADFERDLPEHFLAIAHLLLESARDDVGDDAHKLEGLIEDLENKRHAKLRAWLAQNNPANAEDLQGVTGLEINRVRRFASGAKTELNKLAVSGADEQTQRHGGDGGVSQQPFIDDDALRRTLQRRRG